VNVFGEAIAWLLEPSNYSGPDGMTVRMIEHIQVSFQSLALAFAVALPVGLYVGHRRRFEFVAVTVGNLGRAIPSFGILALFYIWTFYWPGTLGFWAVFFALFFLAIPPILTNTYVGIKGVDPDTVEAARGMGMTERDVLLRLELPLAAPLIVSGTRTAAVQVVATATLGALVSWGGLGRYIVDGLATGDRVQVLVGAVVVAVLAIATELLFGLVERLLAPRLASSQRRVPWSSRSFERPPGPSAGTGRAASS
jgi:osmoprotectant transport system permease protein